MSAVDILPPDPATAPQRQALLTALDAFCGAVGTDATTIGVAANDLLDAINAAPAGTLRDLAVADMVRAAAMAHLDVIGQVDGLDPGQVAQTLSAHAAAMATRALNGGVL